MTDPTEITAQQERIAHLTRMLDDLSDVTAAQADRIDTLERRVRLLLERAAEREVDDGGSLPMADQRPPHW